MAESENALCRRPRIGSQDSIWRRYPQLTMETNDPILKREFRGVRLQDWDFNAASWASNGSLEDERHIPSPEKGKEDSQLVTELLPRRTKKTNAFR